MVIHSEFLDALTPSSIRSITAKIRDKAARGETVVSFAGGLPSAEFFPVEDLRRINEQILREEGGEAIQYAASDGYDPLRKYLVEFMRRYQVTDITYKNILITSGAQQGLAYLAKGLITPGSVVITENPSYPGALDTFNAYGARVVGVNVDGEGMDMDALEHTKMWRLSTPSLISRTPLASACPSPAGNGLWSWRSDITRLWWRTAPIASSPLTARSCRPSRALTHMAG